MHALWTLDRWFANLNIFPQRTLSFTISRICKSNKGLDAEAKAEFGEGEVIGGEASRTFTISTTSFRNVVLFSYSRGSEAFLTSS
jgi:hypothetical protein